MPSTKFPIKNIRQFYWSTREKLIHLFQEDKWGRLNGSLTTRKNLRGKFCLKPFEDFNISDDGKVWVCCTGWLKKSIGDYTQDNLMTSWNSKTAKEIRKSIHNGSFKYCNQDACWHIQKNDLPNKNEISDPHLKKIIDNGTTVMEDIPFRFSMIYDSSCNLTCPSCRKELIYFKEGPKFEKSQAIHNNLMHDLFSEPHNKHIQISCTGSGDPFASPIFRDFLFSHNGKNFPNVIINLTTNGILFTNETWGKMHGIHNNIGNVIVSFDAATSETYQYTRRGGDFNRLIKNFEFINQLRGQGYIKYLKMDFVVQQKNHKEMVDFIRLGKEFNHIDSIGFALITNWGTYPPKEFNYHAIWKKDHPELNDFLTILADPIFDDDLVDLKNLANYRKVALAASHRNGAYPRIPTTVHSRSDIS